MSQRTTAEIVADLRGFIDYYGCDPGVPMSAVDTASEAADRLNELDPDAPRPCNNRSCDQVLPPYWRGVRRLYCSETCRWDCYHTPALRRVATTDRTSR